MLGQPPWHNADTSRKTFSKDARFGRALTLVMELLEADLQALRATRRRQK